MSDIQDEGEGHWQVFLSGVTYNSPGLLPHAYANQMLRSYSLFGKFRARINRFKVLVKKEEILQTHIRNLIYLGMTG